MCDADVQQAILNTLLAERFEYSEPFTAGGATGDYVISSPYNTECEWAIISAASGSSGTTGTGSFVLSSHAKQPNLAWAGGDSLGLASNGRDSSTVLKAYAQQLGNNQSITFTPVWVPLLGNAGLYLAITAGANTTLTVTVMFRRLIEKQLPLPPRQTAQGHHRMGGRAERSRGTLYEEGRTGAGYGR